MSGWIRLYRKVMDSPFYLSEPFTKSSAWIDLLLLANHKTNVFYCRGIKIVAQRGQVAWSKEKLAARWKWSTGKVNRFLNELETDEQISVQNNNVTTTISIINYELYQNSDSYMDGQTDDQTEGQTDDQTETKRRGRQMTNKNVKNVKNDKKEVFPLASVPTPSDWTIENFPLRFALGARTTFLEKNPENKEALVATTKWVDEVVVMMKNDRRSEDRMKEVFKWAMKDPFWSNNLRSISGFRKHFDKIVGQMNYKTEKENV